MTDPPPRSTSLTSSTSNLPSSSTLPPRWNLPPVTDITQSFHYAKSSNPVVAIGGGERGGGGKEVAHEEEDEFDSSRISEQGKRGGREEFNDSITPSTSDLIDRQVEEEDYSTSNESNLKNNQELQRNNLSRDDKMDLVAQTLLPEPVSKGTGFLSALRISSNPPGGIGARIISSSTSSLGRDVFSSPTPSRPTTILSNQMPTPNRTPNSNFIPRPLAPVGINRSSHNPSAPLANSNTQYPDPSRLRVPPDPSRTFRAQPTSPLTISTNQQQQHDQNYNLPTKRSASNVSNSGSSRQGSPASRADSNPSDRTNQIARNGRDLSKEREMSPGSSSRSIKRARIEVDGVEDMLGGIRSELNSKNEKICRMELELQSCRADLVKEVAAKEKLRRLSIGKIKSALSEFENVKKEFQTSSTGMKTAFQDISSELGGVISVADVKVEIADMKEIFLNRNSQESSAQKLESSSAEILRELQGEVNKRQSVIDLLREELATKIGEITESRDRVNQLEAQSNKSVDKIETLVVKLDSKESATHSFVETIAKMGIETRDSGDKALLLAGELEREKGISIKMANKIEDLENTLLEKAEVLKTSQNDLEESQNQLEQFKTLSTTHSCLVVENNSLRQEYSDYRKRSESTIEKFAGGMEVIRKEFEKTAEGLNLQLDKAHEKVEDYDQIKSELAAAITEIKNEKANVAAISSRIQEADTYNKSVLAETRDQVKRLELEAVDRQKTFDITLSEKEMVTKEAKRKERELVNEISQLRTQLRDLNNDLSDSRASQSRIERDSLHGSAEEIQQLRQQLSKARATNDSLAAEILELNAKINLLATEKVILSDLLSDTQTQAIDRSTQIEKLTLEVEKLQLIQVTTEERMNELKANQLSAIQAASAQTYKNCEEESKRALALKANELKKVNNKLEDMTKKNQKALTELARAKNRPLIDAHIASSSPPDRPEEPVDDRSRIGVSVSDVLPAVISPLLPVDAEAIVRQPVTLTSLSESNSSPDEIVDYTMISVESVIRNNTVASSTSKAEGSGTGKGRRTRASAVAERVESIRSMEEEIEDDEESFVQPKSRAAPKTTYTKKKK